MISLRTSEHRLLFRGPPLSYPDFRKALETAPLESPWFELYDVRKDPGEQQDLTGQPGAQETLTRLRDQLVARWSTLEPASTPGPPANNEALEVLRARGYWTP